jgi:hypothetical protein
MPISTSPPLAPGRAIATAVGPASAHARCLIGALYHQIENRHAPRAVSAFTRWERAVGPLYGDSLNRVERADKDGGQPFREYGLTDPKIRTRPFLFAIQTYFVLVAKLLAAEFVSVYGLRPRSGSSEAEAGSRSFLASLYTGGLDRLFRQLCRLEDGTEFEEVGISRWHAAGYDEGYFSWYPDAFDQVMAAWISSLARTLAEVLRGFPVRCRPAGGSFDPPDLLNDLYQSLVPKRIRASLGEFYTPDWLADLVLDETGYRGDPSDRLLDPACGSGTFLVQALRRVARWGNGNAGEPTDVIGERLSQALNGLAGFDLNPVAVEAARVNCLLSFAPALSAMTRPIRLPVFCCDSVNTPREHRDLDGAVWSWRMDGSQLDVPMAAVAGGWLGELLRLAADARTAPVERFLEGVRDRIGAQRLVEAGEESLRRFYRQWLALRGANPSLDAGAVERACVPVSLPRFDRVVGNPPRIRWGALSERYRNATAPLWHHYGLFSLKGLEAILGSGEKDFSILFTYRCADLYLKPGGRLAFLITLEALRSKGAGDGFRRFRLGSGGDHLKVLRVHDLVALSPFAGVGNKTALLVLERGSRTTYPVPFLRWTPRQPGGIATDLSLEEIRRRTRCVRGVARPIGYRERGSRTDMPTSPWRVIEGPDRERRGQRTVSRHVRSHVSSIEGRGAYRAYRGASTEPYGVYWLEVLHPLPPTSSRPRSSRRAPPTIVIENLPEKGKRDVPKVTGIEIEPDLVYPAIRGSDVRRWRATAGVCVLLAQDPLTREGYPEDWLRASYPKTHEYLSRFKDVLLSRGSRAVRDLAQKSSFYAMYGIGPYTLARHKVVWQRLATDMQAAVVGTLRRRGLDSKPAIPTDTTAMVPARNADEAHYLCGVLNAASVRAYIRSFSIGGRGFGAPTILNYVRIPAYDRRSLPHRRIATLSKRAHQAVRTERAAELARIERQLDVAVRKMFGNALRKA